MTTTRVEPPPPATYTCVLDFFLELRGAPCRLTSAAGLEPGKYRCWGEPDYSGDVPTVEVVGERAWWAYVMAPEHPQPEVWVWPATHVFTLG